MGQRSNQKIVDAHLHWWDLDNNYYPWLTDQKKEDGGLSGFDSIAKTYVHSHYMEDADGYEIAGYVHIQAEWDPSDPVGETRWLQGLIDDKKIGSLPLAIVGFANFADQNVEELLEAHSTYANCRGIRHMLNYLSGTPSLCWADQDYLDNQTWLDNFNLLKKYDLDFDLMCFSNHMERAATLARKNPQTQIFLEHAGMPHDHSEDGRAYWKTGMQKLAAEDNTIAKISGLGNTIDNWTEDLIRPYVLEAIEIFGVDRVCFASNFPTDKQFGSMDAIWQAFLSITADFSQNECDKMFANNALKFYNL